MADTTRRAAVLGMPIDHSLSPVLHSAGYAATGLNGWEYTKTACAAEDLARIVGDADETYRGFSVTMPCKFAALEFADEATERARAVGSANTLVRTSKGWRADNTDTDGISAALDELLGDSRVASALVVGAGGTARPALWELGRRGVESVTVINRSDRRGEVAHLVDAAELHFTGFDAALDNLAMSADVIISTVPSHALRPYAEDLAHAPVLDVIYDPWPTPLAVAAAANGHRVVGGLSMLAGQSYSQFEQFTGCPAPKAAMRAALEDHVRALHG